MNSFLRHTALRLWITAIAGCLVCLVLIPWWQSLMGVQWLVLPVFAIMVIFYWAVGWGMNRLGVIQIERHAREATVWERAGMMKEAEFALEQVLAVFDSFWLSPVMRRRRATWVAGRLSRFYLSLPRLSTKALDRIRAYLRVNPQDQAAAEGWLEFLLASNGEMPQDHELASLISEAQTGNPKIQMRLLQFFLSTRRADFAAMQTYRRVWQQPDDLPENLLRTLAAILLDGQFLNDWALKVYLKAYQAGDTDCIEGLAAALRWITPNLENRKDLEAASQIVTAASLDQMDRLIRRFEPPPHRRPAPQVQHRMAKTGQVFQAAAKTWSSAGVSFAVRAYRSFGRLSQILIDLKERLRHGSVSWRRGAGVIAIVLSVIGVGIMGWRAVDEPPVSQTEVPLEEKKQAPVIQDPFTIQVAAYLHPEDADRLVGQLKQHGLDAFRTQAASAQRTWYQVKVSHFASKIQAQEFGQQLKAKGLIDDFYVANYKPEGG